MVRGDGCAPAPAGSEGGRLSAKREQPVSQRLSLATGKLPSGRGDFLTCYAAMDDAVQKLRQELEALRADIASRPISTMFIGEFRQLRERERSLERRIAALGQKTEGSGK